MKLLSPSEVRDTKAQETAREILRTKELNKASDAARKKLANTEADFQQMLAGQQARWAREEQEHTKLVSEMQKEIKELEERREKALVPVYLLEEDAKKTLLEAQNALQRHQEALSDTEELQERLESALDRVGAREQDVALREHRVIAHEQNILLQQKTAEDNLAFARRMLEQLNLAIQKHEQESSDSKKELMLQERSLNARAERLSETERKLTELSIQLKDQRETLERERIRMATPKKKRTVK